MSAGSSAASATAGRVCMTGSRKGDPMPSAGAAGGSVGREFRRKGRPGSRPTDCRVRSLSSGQKCSQVRQMCEHFCPAPSGRDRCRMHPAVGGGAASPPATCRTRNRCSRPRRGHPRGRRASRASESTPWGRRATAFRGNARGVVTACRSSRAVRGGECRRSSEPAASGRAQSSRAPSARRTSRRSLYANRSTATC